MSPKSLAERRGDWVTVVKVWDRIVRYVMDPSHKDEVVKMMAGRANVNPPEDYAKFLPGTRFLSPEEALARFEQKDGLESLYGSGKVADAFNVAQKVYAAPQPVAEYIDSSLAKEALGKSGLLPPARQCAGHERGHMTVRGKSWFQLLRELPPGRRLALGMLSFAIPILAWCVVSYVPFVWHPMRRVTDPGDVSWLSRDQLVEGEAFDAANDEVRAKGGKLASGYRANPVFLPAPHAVARALVTGFTTRPARPDEPWLHQSLWHSITVIFWGFLFSSLLGVPLGILCGAIPAVARLNEPFIEFFRYLPAPAFGALAVAVLGIHDAPKVAIIFIGTFFQQVLVIANTTKRVDPALLEAAQTLGASRRQLLFRVVIPGVVTEIYSDMRVLLGWAWTYLIVAELIGVSSGITYFINQQAKYRAYDKVFASIILIGLIGLATDLFLASLGRQLFPWQKSSRSGWLTPLLQMLRPAPNTSAAGASAAPASPAAKEDTAVA